MTGAFEEGDGKTFGSPAKTVENNFFCIFCGWWRAPSKKEKEIIFVSSVSDDGRLRRRRRRLFLYLLCLMTGAFEEGEGDYFCISCGDSEDGIFFCIFYVWSGRLLGRRRIIFSISSKKKTDNFFVSPAKTVKETFFFSETPFAQFCKEQ